jgi:uncharacterized membrane protein YkvA (DUF1232 family)
MSNSMFSGFDNLLDSKLHNLFIPLCVELPKSDVETLKKAVIEHVGEVEKALRYNEFLDLPTARKIAGILIQLLDDYSNLSHRERKLVVGATNYFVRSQDDQPDLTSLLGFDDDIKVLNYVLERIGRSELRVNH